MIDPEIEQLFLRLDAGDTTWRDSAAVFAENPTEETFATGLAELQVEKVRVPIEEHLGLSLSRDLHVQDAYYWTALEYRVASSPDFPYGEQPLAIVFSEYGNMVTIEVADHWRPVIDDEMVDKVADILREHSFIVIPAEATKHRYTGSMEARNGGLVRDAAPDWTWRGRFFDYI